MKIMTPFLVCIGLIAFASLRVDQLVAVSSPQVATLEMKQSMRTSLQAVPQEEAKQIEKEEKELEAIADSEEITVTPTLKERLLEMMGGLATGVLHLDIPQIGMVELAPFVDPVTNAVRLKFKLITPAKTTIVLNPTILTGAQIERYEKKLTGKLHTSDSVTLFGKKAQIKVREISLIGAGGLVSRIAFQVQFLEPITFAAGGLGTIKISQGYLILKRSGEYPVVLVASTKEDKPSSEQSDSGVSEKQEETRILLLYKPGILSAAVKVMNMPLIKLIPQVRNTILQHLDIIKGRVVIDIWNATSKNATFPEFDSARRLRIQAELVKQPLPELPVDEEPIQEDITESISKEFEQEVTEEMIQAFIPLADAQPPEIDAESALKSPEERALEALPDEPIREPLEEVLHLSEISAPQKDVDPFGVEVTPEKAPGISVDPKEVVLDSALLKEALPTPEPLDREPLEEAVVKEKPVIVCDPFNDPCCRDPNEKLSPTYLLQALVSSKDVSLSIGAQDLVIPNLGVLMNAQVSLVGGRRYEEREDVELRPELSQKTLKTVSGELSIEADCLPLKKIGNLEHLSLHMKLERAEKEKFDESDVVYKKMRGTLDLNATLRLSIPQLGRVPFLIQATLSKQGMYIRGKLDACRKLEVAKASASGRVESSPACVDRALSYAGFAIENLQLVYGNPPLHAAEQKIYDDMQSKRRERREKASEMRTELRRLQESIAAGEPVDAELLTETQIKTSTLSQEELARYKQAKAISLIGTCNIYGIRLITTLTLQSDPQTPGKMKWYFSAKGVLKNFRPFRYLKATRNMAGLKDITFDEVSAEMRIGMVKGRPAPSVTLSGSALLFGALVRANFKWVVSKEGVPGVVMYTTPQKQQSLADVIPILYGDFFKNITCCNGSFVFSSVDNVDMSYFSPEEQLELSFLKLGAIKRGANFVANIPFTGSLDKVGQWLGVNKKEGKTKQAQTVSSSKMKISQKLCSADQRMFRMSGVIDFAHPRRTEFRIGVLRSQLKNITSTSYQSEKQIKTRQEAAARAAQETPPTPLFDTKFSTTSLNPFAKETAPGLLGGSSMPANLGGKEAKLPMVELDGVEVFIAGDPVSPAAGVAASIIFRPASQEELYLKGSVEFSASAVTLGAQMLGMWKNAFTLRGWDLSNVGLLLGFTYGSIIPTRLGGAGTLLVKHGSPILPQKLGAAILPSAVNQELKKIPVTAPEDFSIATKFMADANFINVGFEGSVSRVITWYDLVELCLRAAASKVSVDLSKVPTPLELRNVKIKYAPQDIKIGDQYLEAGIGAQADFTLLGKKGAFDLHADYSGIRGFGTIEKITLEEVLEITDAQGKGDPKVDIALSFDYQSFLITGRIRLAQLVEAIAYMEISSQGFAFNFMSALGQAVFEGKPLLLAQVRGKTSGSLTHPNFAVSFEFQQNLKKFIIQEATKNLQAAEGEIKTAIGDAQSELKRINRIKQQSEVRIKQIRVQLQDAQNTLRTIQKAREGVRSKIQAARNNVESIKQEIRKLETWYQSLPAV